MSSEISNIQGKLVGNIVCKPEVKDYEDRRMQGFTLTLEIAKDVIDDETALLALFNGDTVHIQIQDAARSITSKFITSIKSFKSATRTDGDDEIRYFSIPLTVVRGQVRKPDNLFDLQLEESVYITISPHQLSAFETKKEEK